MKAPCGFAGGLFRAYFRRASGRGFFTCPRLARPPQFLEVLERHTSGDVDIHDLPRASDTNKESLQDDHNVPWVDLERRTSHVYHCFPLPDPPPEQNREAEVCYG